MQFFITSTAVAALVLGPNANAFMAPSPAKASGRASTASQPNPFGTLLSPQTTQLFAQQQTDSEISQEVERLRSMAAKLRAEASSMEAEKAQENAEATERAFKKFDSNQDGKVSFEELKNGLEKVLKTELKEDRVKKLLQAFDASGDGALQLDEFVSVEQFGNKLDAIVRDEKNIALEAAKQASLEKEASALAEARMEMLNDKPPTNTDKLVSILPYLFPLMDGLAFGRFLLADSQNPAVGLLALLFTVYRSIPLGGFISFLSLTVLSGNPSINRLIRYNMQQAIYVDIALFFPGFIGTIYALAGQGLGFSIPENMTQMGSDAIFVTLLATIGYSVISSLLGVTPDKLPIISDTVNKRMPTIDMFDEEGRFVPRNPNDEDTKDE